MHKPRDQPWINWNDSLVKFAVFESVVFVRVLHEITVAACQPFVVHHRAQRTTPHRVHNEHSAEEVLAAAGHEEGHTESAQEDSLFYLIKTITIKWKSSTNEHVPNGKQRYYAKHDKCRKSIQGWQIHNTQRLFHDFFLSCHVYRQNVLFLLVRTHELRFSSCFCWICSTLIRMEKYFRILISFLFIGKVCELCSDKKIDCNALDKNCDCLATSKETQRSTKRGEDALSFETTSTIAFYLRLFEHCLSQRCYRFFSFTHLLKLNWVFSYY